uniref:General transcription factor IIF subunit 2 n=1 Tax=Globodera pallida TaxID=36090 RepID=A0A183CAW0_GLOPA
MAASSSSLFKKRPPPAEEPPELAADDASDVNTEKASRGVWLVKVPRYLSEHTLYEVNEARKEGVRAIRLERDEVVSLLFNAFERHQFYRQADLQRITNQPASVVREVLNDIGLYHDSAPHRSMWALKPEYRNYSKQLARNVEQKLQQQQKQKDDK